MPFTVNAGGTAPLLVQVPWKPGAGAWPVRVRGRPARHGLGAAAGRSGYPFASSSARRNEAVHRAAPYGLHQVRPGSAAVRPGDGRGRRLCRSDFCRAARVGSAQHLPRPLGLADQPRGHGTGWPPRGQVMAGAVDDELLLVRGWSAEQLQAWSTARQWQQWDALAVRATCWCATRLLPVTRPQGEGLGTCPGPGRWLVATPTVCDVGAERRDGCAASKVPRRRGRSHAARAPRSHRRRPARPRPASHAGGLRGTVVRPPARISAKHHQAEVARHGLQALLQVRHRRIDERRRGQGRRHQVQQWPGGRREDAPRPDGPPGQHGLPLPHLEQADTSTSGAGASANRVSSRSSRLKRTRVNGPAAAPMAGWCCFSASPEIACLRACHCRIVTRKVI